MFFIGYQKNSGVYLAVVCVNAVMRGGCAYMSVCVCGGGGGGGLFHEM